MRTSYRLGNGSVKCALSEVEIFFVKFDISPYWIYFCMKWCLPRYSVEIFTQAMHNGYWYKWVEKTCMCAQLLFLHKTSTRMLSNMLLLSLFTSVQWIHQYLTISYAVSDVRPMGPAHGHGRYSPTYLDPSYCNIEPILLANFAK